MSTLNLPPCPPSLKQIQHYLKTASEHDARDVIVAYWCRLYALQLGLKIDKASPEAKKLLVTLMDWLEKTKSEQKDNEAVIHDIPAQAHLENYALKLFLWADSQDRASIFNKNVVKAFYTAGMIYDVLDTFGEATEEVQQNKKYAKWKAAYIHNCLKNGETPVPGPMLNDDENKNIDDSSSDALLPPGPSFPISTNENNESRVPYPIPGGNGMGSGSVFPTPPVPPSPDAENQLNFPKTPNFPSNEDPVSPTKPPDSSELLDFTNPKAAEIITSSTSGTGVQLSPEQITKAQKYCKWAASALNYDDVPTAVNNLEKALHLLTTGVDQ